MRLSKRRRIGRADMMSCVSRLGERKVYGRWYSTIRQMLHGEAWWMKGVELHSELPARHVTGGRRYGHPITVPKWD